VQVLAFDMFKVLFDDDGSENSRPIKRLTTLDDQLLDDSGGPDTGDSKEDVLRRLLKSDILNQLEQMG